MGGLKLKIQRGLDYLKKDVTRVLFATAFNKVLSLLLSIIIVRMLTKAEYGLYTFAFNKIAIALIFSGLGIISGVMQYCSEDRDDDEKRSMYRFGFFYGISVNVVLSICLFLYGVFAPIKLEGAAKYIQYLSAVPVFSFLYEYGNIYLRTQNRMTQYANSTNINTLAYLIASVALTFMMGLNGYVLGYYVSFAIALVYIVSISSKNSEFHRYVSIRKEPSIYKSLLKFSTICALTNSLSSLLNYIGVELVGFVVPDPEILASYKIGIGIPDNASFITLAIITALYPSFAKNQVDYQWLKQHTKKLLLGLATLNGFVAIAMFIGAKPIINILYGPDYMDAVPLLQIAAVGFLISSVFRIPFGNLLLAMRKVRFNLLVCVICGLINIVFNLLLIPRYGSLGAAYTSIIVAVVSGVMSTTRYVIYLKEIKKQA